MYFEALKDKDIFALLFHHDDKWGKDEKWGKDGLDESDWGGLDKKQVDTFKKDCKKEKLIFTAAVTGPTRTSVRPPLQKPPLSNPVLRSRMLPCASTFPLVAGAAHALPQSLLLGHGATFPVSQELRRAARGACMRPAGSQPQRGS